MLKFIENILLCFHTCFSREASFGWFVTIIVGFMVRSDRLGITSVIRDLALKPALYNSMEHFFRADSWEWKDIFIAWARTISSHTPLKRIAGRAVLVGDGVKRASDGKYMPCTKKMVQESESASKLSFIHGHLWGAVGILIGNASKIFCLPLSIQINDGDGAISGWLGDESVSHVVQMLRDGFRAVRYIGMSLFVLDRYFLTKPLCLLYQDDIQVSDFRYLRTLSCKVISEASVMEYLRRNLFRFMGQQGNLTITKIISSKQDFLKTEVIGRLIN